MDPINAAIADANTGGVLTYQSFATGTIHMSGVPANADVLGAFLYWEQLTGSSTAVASAGVFRGHQVIGKQIGPSGVPACFGSGGGAGNQSGAQSLHVYRADVLRDLPFNTDANGNPTTKVLVNDSDLAANNLPLTVVSLPDSGGGGTTSNSSGNQVIYTEGASLVVIYRVPGDPLRSVVIYDGAFTFNGSNDILQMQQAIQGFYQASTTQPVAKLTEIVGNGRANFREQLIITGQAGSQTSQTPFVGAQGSAWDNPTFNVSALLAGNDASISTQVQPGSPTSAACLSWGAIIFSTTVQDTDGDGLLDVWETTPGGVVDPNGHHLPDLSAMGANPKEKDVFIEIGYLKTNGYATGQGVVPAHSHLPSKAALDLVGDALKNSPVPNPDGTTGIHLHVDVGNNYQGDPYIVPGAVARGGESINEFCPTDAAPCVPSSSFFSDYPGTIGWKTGFRFLRDQPLNFPSESTCLAAGDSCQRRFDPNRQDIFRYALFAHAVALPKWLIADGTLISVVVSGGTATVNTFAPHGLASGNFASIAGAPASSGLNGTYTVAAVNSTTSFTIRIPNAAAGTYKTRGLGVGNGVPRSTSGIADLPGGDLMVTLGLWDNFTGSDFMNASTLMHEMGHTFDLTHQGGPPTIGNTQPNCKPNYESVMSYLFQVTGLLDAKGAAHIDYSRQILPTLYEQITGASGLSETAGLGGMTYRTRWYVPMSSSFLDVLLGTTVVKNKHCNGTPLGPAEVATVRVDSPGVTSPLDWNADGTIEPGFLPTAQDLDFNGTTTDGPFFGFNDWNNVDLRQVGGRRNVAKLSLNVGFLDLADGGISDGGISDGGISDGGISDGGISDGGISDGGISDGGISDGGISDGGDEMDSVTARAVGDVPTALSTTGGKLMITLNWQPPHVGSVIEYDIFRATGAFSPANHPQKVGSVVPIAPATTPATTFVDTTVQNNRTYTYVVVAITRDSGAAASTQSGPSNQAVCNFQQSVCQP